MVCQRLDFFHDQLRFLPVIAVAKRLRLAQQVLAAEQLGLLPHGMRRRDRQGGGLKLSQLREHRSRIAGGQGLLESFEL